MDSINNLSQTAQKLKCRQLSEQGCAIFEYNGLSMFPFFLNGDRITVQAYRTIPPKLGDVVVFSQGSQLVLHRLIRIRKSFSENSVQYITKGDNCQMMDTPIGKSDILGQAIEIQRGTSKIRLNSFKGYLVKILMTYLPPWRLSYRFGLTFAKALFRGR